MYRLEFLPIFGFEAYDYDSGSIVNYEKLDTNSKDNYMAIITPDRMREVYEINKDKKPYLIIDGEIIDCDTDFCKKDTIKY